MYKNITVKIIKGIYSYMQGRWQLTPTYESFNNEYRFHPDEKFTIIHDDLDIFWNKKFKGAEPTASKSRIYQIS